MLHILEENVHLIKIPYDNHSILFKYQVIIKITFNCGLKKYNRYVPMKQLLNITKIFLISFFFPLNIS